MGGSWVTHDSTRTVYRLQRTPALLVLVAPAALPQIPSCPFRFMAASLKHTTREEQRLDSVLFIFAPELH